METDQRLEEFLTQCGLDWQVVPEERHVSLCNEWEALYGDCSDRRFRQKTGGKAQFGYSRQIAEEFVIVPFLGDVAGPHSINKPGRRKAAYECHGDGTLPDLSAFAPTDFFIVPDELSWTMIHTHENASLGGFGGPYFIRKEWLVPAKRERRRR